MPIVIKGDKFTVSGNIENLNGTQISNLEVKAFDKDLNKDDFLGSARSSEDGSFQITFDKSRFANIFENRPNLYFEVYHGNTLLLDTDKTWVARAKATSDPITLKVSLPDAAVSPDLTDTNSATPEPLVEDVATVDPDLTMSFINSLDFDVKIYAIDATTGKPGSLLGDVAKGATGTLTFPATNRGKTAQVVYSGVINGFNSNYYDKFPLLNFVIPATGTLPSKTVNNTNKVSATQAFKFFQLSQSSPNSPLVTQFMKALATQPTSANPQAGIDAVNTFFSGTTAFNACTWYSYFMLVNWFATNTSGWQGTYYLYQNQTPASYVIAAEMNIVSSNGTNTAVLNEYKDGKPVSPAVPVSLTFSDDGTLAGTVSALTVSLNLGWAPVGTATEPIVATAIGTIKGANVVGGTSKRIKPPATTTIGQSAQESDSKTLEIFAVVVASVATVIAGVLALPSIVQMIKSGRDAFEPDAGPLDSETMKELFGPDSDFMKAMRHAGPSKKELADYLKEKQTTELKEQAGDMYDIAKNAVQNDGLPVNPTVEEFVGRIKESASAITEGRFSDAVAKLKEGQELIPQVKEHVTNSIADADVRDRILQSLDEASTGTDTAVARYEARQEYIKENDISDPDFDPIDPAEPVGG